MADKILVKILVVGQTPPPYGGQAMMINRMVQAQFTRLQVFHVRMCFSDSFRSVGSFGLKKVCHLFQVVYQALRLRFKHGIPLLYFPPAGPNRNPILRDMLLLWLMRPFFKKTVYHFRAAGISEFLRQQPALLQTLAKAAYGKPSAAFQLSARNPADGRYFGADRVCIIPDGLEDAAQPYLGQDKPRAALPRILFVGVLREDKGVSVLIQAAALLKQRGHGFRLTLVGEFVSDHYQQQVQAAVAQAGLEEWVSFAGVRTGQQKWDLFHQADLLCFPSFFESESFGNVVVEAMMFALPVVATRWRGIPDIVVEGETGLLVPPCDAQALAQALAALLADGPRRQWLGQRGRERFVAHYTLTQHLRAMEEALVAIAHDQPLPCDRPHSLITTG